MYKDRVKRYIKGMAGYYLIIKNRNKGVEDRWYSGKKTKTDKVKERHKYE